MYTMLKAYCFVEASVFLISVKTNSVLPWPTICYSFRDLLQYRSWKASRSPSFAVSTRTWTANTQIPWQPFETWSLIWIAPKKNTVERQLDPESRTHWASGGVGSPPLEGDMDFIWKRRQTDIEWWWSSLVWDISKTPKSTAQRNFVKLIPFADQSNLNWLYGRLCARREIRLFIY